MLYICITVANIRNLIKTILTYLTLFSTCISISQLSGVVYDADNKQPIPYATIELVDLATGITADENGTFKFDISIPWHSKVKITAVGYSAHILEIEDNTDRDNLVVSLFSKHYHLHEAVISAGTGILQDYTITNVISAPMSELSIIKPANVGEAITNLSGVYNNSMGNGIYKPVIRGLSGIRVLSFLNGVRLENQQWGGDHGLGVSSVGIGQVEVIKGPASLLYGADALGGVLHLTDETFAKNNSVEAKIESKVSSNTRGVDNAGQVKINTGGIRFNAFINHQDHADYQMGNDLFVKNSRYKGIGGKFLLGYNKKNWVTKLGYNISQSRISLPGHTHDSIVNLSSFTSTNQGRRKSSPAQVINNHLITFDNQFFFHHADLKITLGHQANQLQEFEKLTIPEIDMRLNTTNYYARYHYGFKDVDLIVGAQGVIQRNINPPGIPEELIPNYNNIDNGVFGILNGKKGKLNYQLGARIDNRSITVYDEPIDTMNREFHYLAGNYSAGLSYKLEQFAVRLNISTGTRMPHVSELLSNGVHHATNRYEIGVLNLKPEQGTQIDISFEFNKEHIDFIINPFVNQINNYIFLKPLDSTIDNNPAYTYTQTDRANLIGGDFSFHWHPHFLHDFHLESNVSFLYAEAENNEPITFTPQPRLTNVLTYSFDHDEDASFKVSNISLQYQLFNEQNRVVDYEIATKGYQLLHIGTNAKWELSKDCVIDIGFGVRNLLNAQFIDHLSNLKQYNIQGQGRNIYVSLGFNFNSKLKTNKNKEQ